MQLDDGHGEGDLLNLIVEIKGYRGEDAKEKNATMETYWLPGVNNLKEYGRWAFAELTDVYGIEAAFGAKVEAEFDRAVASALKNAAKQKDRMRHYDEVVTELRGKLRTGGQTFSRDEMNER